MERPEIKSGQIVKGGFFGSQKKAWDATLRQSKSIPVTMFIGGYGAGKSKLGAKWDIAISLQNAPPESNEMPLFCPHWVICPTLVMAKNSAIPDIRGLLDGKGIRYTFNKSESSFRIFHRGRVATIIVKSGENAASLVAASLGSARIDEPFLIAYDVFSQILARIRNPHATHKAILLTGTPEGLGWGYELAEGELKNNYDVVAIHAKTSENKALPPESIEALKRSFHGDKALMEAYFNGEFVSTSDNLIYNNFDHKEHVRDIDTKGMDICVGMDFGVNPMAFVIYARTPDGLHMLENVELKNANTNKAAEWLLDKYGSGLDIIPDATGSRAQSSSGGKSDHAILRSHPFNNYVLVHRSNPLRRDRTNAVNSMLMQGRLTFSPSCRIVLRALKQANHSDIDTKQKHLSHILDAMGYPVVKLYPCRIARP